MVNGTNEEILKEILFDRYLTDNEHSYLQMINNHHPGHKKNIKLKVAGGINDLKLRMHPLAAILAKYDLKKFENRNKELIKKIKLMYDYLDNLGIQHPYNENSKIGGFHFGIPFFSNKNLSSCLIIPWLRRSVIFCANSLSLVVATPPSPVVIIFTG